MPTAFSAFRRARGFVASDHPRGAIISHMDGTNAIADRPAARIRDKDPLWKRLRAFGVALLVGGGLLAALVGLIPFIWDRITNDLPKASWEVSPHGGEAPLVVLADMQVSDPDGDDVEVSWYLDDQLETKGSATNHEYHLERPGTYRLSAEVSDGRGKPVVRKQIVTVTPTIVKLTDLNLDAPLVLRKPSANLEVVGEIVTNGHDVKIEVGDIVGSPLRIRSFAHAAVNGRPGGAGGSGRPGNNGNGDVGGGGEGGDAGGLGTSGASAGGVFITAQSIRTPVTIINTGQDGGNGGNGGPGGSGGAGGQGSPSSAGFSIGNVGDCKSGPGSGGKGGDGGKGGPAGGAGAGGNGGTVEINARSIDGLLNIRTTGGQPGTAGTPGKGGVPGDGGPEGALNGPCQSAGRHGANGQRGAEGARGTDGHSGGYGSVDVVVGDEHLTGSAGVLKR